MPDTNNQTENESIRQLLAENNRLLKELSADVAKVQRHIQWNRVWSVLRLLIIVVPIVLGIIYLKPYAKGVFSTYQELLAPTGSGGNTNSGSLDLLDQLKQYEQQLNN